jgi:hypothetical protein
MPEINKMENKVMNTLYNFVHKNGSTGICVSRGQVFH